MYDSDNEFPRSPHCSDIESNDSNIDVECNYPAGHAQDDGELSFGLCSDSDSDDFVGGLWGRGPVQPDPSAVSDDDADSDDDWFADAWRDDWPSSSSASLQVATFSEGAKKFGRGMHGTKEERRAQAYYMVSCRQKKKESRRDG